MNSSPRGGPEGHGGEPTHGLQGGGSLPEVLRFQKKMSSTNDLIRDATASGVRACARWAKMDCVLFSRPVRSVYLCIDGCLQFFSSFLLRDAGRPRLSNWTAAALQPVGFHPPVQGHFQSIRCFAEIFWAKKKKTKNWWRSMRSG